MDREIQDLLERFRENPSKLTIEEIQRLIGSFESEIQVGAKELVEMSRLQEQAEAAQKEAQQQHKEAEEKLRKAKQFQEENYSGLIKELFKEPKEELKAGARKDAHRAMLLTLATTAIAIFAGVGATQWFSIDYGERFASIDAQLSILVNRDVKKETDLKKLYAVVDQIEGQEQKSIERIGHLVSKEQHLPGMQRDQYGIYADVEIKTNAQSVTQRFRWIEPGTFMMGSPESEEGRDDDEIRHQVTLTKGYWIADTETTQQLWQAVMNSNPSSFKGEQRPVEEVSWNDVRQFLKKLNQFNPKLNAKLPTEAQWEYATRAGTSTPFSFGRELTLEKVNYSGNWDNREWGVGSKKETVNVKSLPPNPWGLYEVHGNVWEWVADTWQEKLSAEPVSDPLVETESSRVIRGGSWDVIGRGVRSAVRYHDDADDRSHYLGFRISLGH